MYQAFTGGLGGIALAKHGRSRAINAENPHGEKGKGGMAASHLGPSRKGSPCLKDIEPGNCGNSGRNGRTGTDQSYLDHSG